MTSIKHTSVMAAITKSMADGRASAFRENPSEETRDAIVNVVSANLTRLMKGKSVSTKPVKTEKTEKATKAEKTQRQMEKDRVEKKLIRVRRLATDVHPNVIGKRGNIDTEKFRKYVSRKLTNLGLDVQTVKPSGTSIINRNGHLFNIKFNTAEPVVTYLGINA